METHLALGMLGIGKASVSSISQLNFGFGKWDDAHLFNEDKKMLFSIVIKMIYYLRYIFDFVLIMFCS